MSNNINIPLHPDLKKHQDEYNRIKILIESDESKYSSDVFCLKLPNEPSNAREVRKKLFTPSFRNITLDLLMSPVEAIFKEKIRLDFEDKEGVLSDWTKKVTCGQDEISLLQYAKENCAISLRGYGMIWTVIDKPNYEASSMADELENGMPYITNISPLNVLNYEFVNGEMIWFAYKREYSEPWIDPTMDAPECKKQICIWTKTDFIVSEDGQVKEITPHNFGIVPVVYQSFFLPPDEDTIVGITPFFTSSNLIIFANNMKSIADMELAKHGNSVLLCHEQGISAMNMETDSGGTPRTKLQDAAGFNVYVWHGEKPPAYLTKDLAAVTIADDRAQMYFAWAIDNEKSMRSIMKAGASGEDIAESGISKTFDAAPVLASLTATSQDLESWTKKVLSMIAKILNVDKSEYVVEFPSRFDIAQRELEKRLADIKTMTEIGYPSDRGLRTAWKRLTAELTPNAEEQEEINKEIDAAILDSEKNMDNELAVESKDRMDKMKEFIRSKGLDESEAEKYMQFGNATGE